MICYAAHTCESGIRTRLRASGWGLLGSAAYRWEDDEWQPRHAGGLGWALDNGAWTYAAKGLPFDGEQFRRAVDECGDVDWIACPDVVCDADGTRHMIDEWLPWLERQGRRVLVVVQDGMTPDDVGNLSDNRGIFVGGNTAWKLATAPAWAAECAKHGAWCHVGRVNSAKRVRMMRGAGVTSVDGSGPSRFGPDCLRRINQGRTGPVQMEAPWAPW